MRAELGDDVTEYRLVFQLLVVVEQTLHLHRVLAFLSNLILQVLHKNELELEDSVESGERPFYFSQDLDIAGDSSVQCQSCPWPGGDLDPAVQVRLESWIQV